MDEVMGYSELASLNSELAEAYLKDAENDLFLTIEKLESRLKLMKELRKYELFCCITQ
ncbi:hypothetical protein ACFLXH_05835 [Chloroflexota bacterium]